MHTRIFFQILDVLYELRGNFIKFPRGQAALAEAKGWADLRGNTATSYVLTLVYRC